MSDTEEIAKAVAETSKFGTKSLETTEKILGFLAKVFDESIEHAVGIVSDRLKFLRWQRQVRMVDKIEQELRQHKVVKTRPVAPKFALPILENASLEEDDDLQDLWVRLMANAMDPNFEGGLRMAFIDIIKSLTPSDVMMLDFFYTVLHSSESTDLSVITSYSITKENICAGLGIEERVYFESVYNLFRVQCLTPAILKGGVRLGSEPLTIFKGADAVSMTPLGHALVEACIKS